MHAYIIENLAQNIFVFEKLLKSKKAEEFNYRQKENKWCLLEIICHLHNEEVEDF